MIHIIQDDGLFLYFNSIAKLSCLRSKSWLTKWIIQYDDQSCWTILPLLSSSTFLIIIGSYQIKESYCTN